MSKEVSKPPLEEHGRAGHGTEEEDGEGEPEVYGEQKEEHSQYRKTEVRDPCIVPPEHFVMPPSINLSLQTYLRG